MVSGTGEECQRDRLCGEAAALPLSPDAQDAQRLFLSVRSQWRVGFGGPTGLDYGGVAAAAKALEIPWEADVLSRLQVLENEQLAIWAEEQKDDRKPS